MVDVESNDNIEAIRVVETRTDNQKKVERRVGYEFNVRGESPFYMGEDGKLRLKDEWVPEVRKRLDKKKNIHSSFMNERHPTD